MLPVVFRQWRLVLPGQDPQYYLRNIGGPIETCRKWCCGIEWHHPLSNLSLDRHCSQNHLHIMLLLTWFWQYIALKHIFVNHCLLFRTESYEIWTIGYTWYLRTFNVKTWRSQMDYHRKESSQLNLCAIQVFSQLWVSMLYLCHYLTIDRLFYM